MTLKMRYFTRPVQTPDNTRIGAEARVERTRAGLTLGQVAAEMGVSIGYLSHLERGFRAWNQDLVDSFDDAIQRIKERR